MARMGFGERVRIAAVSARRSAASHLLGSPLLRWRYGSHAAHEFTVTPQDLRTADLSFWPEVQSGHFGLSATLAELDGQSPFAIEPPNAAWARELHGFGWLRHLEATGDAQARHAARGYVLTWLRQGARRPAAAQEPAVVARRVMSWICHAAFLFDEATPAQYDAITRAIASEVVRLSATWRQAADGLPRLTALAALVSANLAITGRERQLRSSLAGLEAELDRQILPDGGHISRNPGVIVEVLLDTLPLLQCFDASNCDRPQGLAAAVRRMLPMLRFMRLGDGRLARFNGLGIGQPAGLATLLAYDDRPLPDWRLAPQSRYVRLDQGASALLMDVGPPPALEFSGEAHSGCLSFEFSSGHRVLFVNAGAPGPADAAWRSVSRATASHTAVTVGELSSSELVRHPGLEAMLGAVPIQLPSTVTAVLGDDQGALTIDASHDGYRQRLGVVHRRQLRVAEDGRLLAGIETIEAQGGQGRLARDLPFSAHFHLHPDAAVTTAPDGTVEIELPGAERWTFRAEGATVSIDESMFFAGSSGPRGSLQIVLRGVTAGATAFTWSATRA
jgi:uncharacterized heparinase superfamily protein